MKFLSNIFLLISVFMLNLNATIINVPADIDSIQGGINLANSGDTVPVHPGTYVENINFNGKNIVVGSLTLNTGDTSYISQTVIDGNQNDRVATLVNVTLSNNYCFYGGGGISFYCNQFLSYSNRYICPNDLL